MIQMIKRIIGAVYILPASKKDRKASNVIASYPIRATKKNFKKYLRS